MKLLLQGAKMKMWQGRFSQSSSELLEHFNASIFFDKELFEEDIQGSIAHSQMLANCGIISREDASEMKRGLQLVLEEIRAGKFDFKVGDEDIHMAVEKRLGELVGTQIAGRLHTARSRNDQVATDFRLFCQKSTAQLSHLTKGLILELVKIAKPHTQTLLPGYTHLQHAQPISLAFWAMAYAAMFCRDVERLNASYKRANFSPLGSAALAGTPHPINRFESASLLGFDAPCFNAADGVSDRDFALELLFNISVIFTHTSRLCEELILWNSSEFKFIEISDRFATGSSIMPQKKNPDVAELIRGKTGRALGNLVGLFTTLKSLPLAYNKDMQEDKEGVFDSVKAANESLVILTAMLGEVEFLKENMLNAAKKGHLSATDLADFLVREAGVPFREAHFIVGRCVAKAEGLGVDLSELDLAALQSVDERITAEAMSALGLQNSMNARQSYGGTSQRQVETQIAFVENFLAQN